jgi:hypothetical protein
MTARGWIVASVLGLLGGLSGSVWGWWSGGHEAIAEAAASILPDEVPAFFRAAGKQLAHYAVDPDRWKNPGATALKATEFPEHFIDLELFQGKPLPQGRYQAIKLLVELKVDPDKAGLLPYAILDNWDRLRVAFYDLRQDPNNETIRAKCLVYAGTLSHYTGDLSMPLHTTVNYDGKPDPNGKLQQKGIHAKIDAFPERNNFTAVELARGLTAKVIEEPWKHVVKCIEDSHKHVERCYELDAADAIARPTMESRQFILERCRFGVQLTADLWYSAWVSSAKLPKHW